MKRINDFISALWQTLLSIVKIIIQSHWLPYNLKSEGNAPSGIVILGNGPSLNDTITQFPLFLEERDLLAVNFAACTDMFTTFKPSRYVLADPHFFKALEQPNVIKLWNVITTKVSWDMSLFIPAGVTLSPQCAAAIAANHNVKIIRYNTTPVEGFQWFENMIYSSGLGMPRPRNVLIPSLMLALRMRYKSIYLAGADHSWTKTLSVDDDNNVVSIQPHFYKEDTKEVQRVNTEYMHYPLHHILHSFYVAFKSYFTISRYASHIGASVFNITPGSFIDAFPRLKL